MAHSTALLWLRRDLRLHDNVALERAAKAADRVVVAFVLDPKLLRGERVGAPIVSFFFDALTELRATLREYGSDLALLEGDFATELTALARRTSATAVFYSVDYVADAIARDAHVTKVFEENGITVDASLDHVYYGKDEVLKPDGSPYTVFTPYKRRWLERFETEPREPRPSREAAKEKFASRDVIGATREVPKPEEYGHTGSELFPRGGEARGRELLADFAHDRITRYATDRNDPAIAGTSHLSPHLRAGTIGIRTCVATARDALSARHATGAQTWLSELIWRDFYQQILANFPHVETEPFLANAKRLRFRDSDGDFEAWAAARTGYPIVDAAMTQLRRYGWMHNRLRMIVASFFTKDLLLDYRRGERFFEQHLADGEVAANNGGWQWSASTGTDAAPYFRVFNPVLQSQKFDPDGRFIRSMLPVLERLPSDAIHAPWTLSPLEAESLGFRLGRDYPEPIVNHAEARDRALALYSPIMGKQK